MKKVAIIGGGPGGYVTAIRLQQYGIDTMVFEKERLGGVCLNWGCIPTKSYVKVAELFAEIKEAENFGLSVKSAKVEYDKIWERKNKVVEQLVSGVEFMFQKRKIPNLKEVVTKIIKTDEKYKIITDQNQYEADFIVLATGSKPKELPFLKFDGEKILSSKDLLSLQELPKKLVVVGGGVVGCEFASIYNKFGVEVEIVEFLPNLVSMEDIEISKRLAMALKRSGIKVHLKTAVEDYEKDGEKIILKLSNGKEIETEKVLVSVGRAPVCDLKFENCSLDQENGFIYIDNYFHTNLKNVFAIGDVTGKLMLAHTASKQGLIVADLLHNEINSANEEILDLDYNKIPACTFTNPEIGSVGFTEDEAKEKYEEILVGKFPFTANGKALGSGSTFGFVKTIADKKNHQLVGMHIIGPQATELIAQGGILIGSNATIADVKKIVFAHPTLSEAVMESIEDLEKLAIHKM
ncbi:MAG: dihydrolipoyl dehydrogenase [Candidatus Cloacimonetes bacterium]|nr:dihydrolipoyl dehydrogenase [Candidatus Cloacimonadota bacterium]MCF7812903.1 dihydrolipoyl dehydrogenase [Candidatus Cloacimonadota bacterium]MCF7867115.1 dihydrolipoyl dehydrogenase [Candidatus Cloacimonadota bacterium]MCF7882565.1 dihydrolipoyl dehydrogenase [Candidatus Cloacimonadota bacterium]